ncbi:hypothetical protein [Bifidobacterium sp. ESL0745]|uniref:hypothetical protein n=1 Tax=Bifidobacterium sp. ESL0745 TaxID=2983226 RepID=UPI0023F7F906|nr:hypothetical protein [Bifidobacterium sp. ESL0745]MDF7665933.1 hypothetical protein [Bifidobacterium sp. ESL0745]
MKTLNQTWAAPSHVGARLFLGMAHSPRTNDTPSSTSTPTMHPLFSDQIVTAFTAFHRSRSAFLGTTGTPIINVTITAF